GGKHKVDREGGLDGDLRSFEVPDFADENDVGVLAQKSAQGSGEVQTDLFLHLDIIDAHQVELDRVFSRHDVCFDGVQRLQRGVERVCLTASRWSSNEDHAVRL